MRPSQEPCKQSVVGTALVEIWLCYGSNKLSYTWAGLGPSFTSVSGPHLCCSSGPLPSQRKFAIGALSWLIWKSRFINAIIHRFQKKYLLNHQNSTLNITFYSINETASYLSLSPRAGGIWMAQQTLQTFSFCSTSDNLNPKCLQMTDAVLPFF